MNGVIVGLGLGLIIREQFAESARLEEEIKRNLGGLGYEF